MCLYYKILYEYKQSIDLSYIHFCKRVSAAPHEEQPSREANEEHDANTDAHHQPLTSHQKL